MKKIGFHLRSAYFFIACWLPHALIAQNENWNDTLTSILKSTLSDSSKISALGVKAIALNNLANPAAIDFIKKQMHLALKTKNAASISYSYYTSAVVSLGKVSNDSLFQLIDSCLFNAKQSKVLLMLVRANRIKAQLNERISNMDEAEKYIKEATKYTKELNIPLETARTVNAFGHIEERKGNMKDALNYFLVALEYFENNADANNLPLLYNKIGNIYLTELNFEKAYYYFNRNKEFCENIAPRFLPTVFLSMATYYYQKEDHKKALEYYNLAEAKMNELGDFSQLDVVYSNKSTLYQKLNEVDSAKKYFSESIRIIENDQSIFEYRGRVYLNYSTFLSGIGEHDSAVYYVEKAFAFAQKEKDNYGLSEALKAKAEIYAAKKDYEKSYRGLKETINFNDSLSKIEKAQEINNLLAQYEAEKKENEIEKLTSDKKIQNLELEKQKAVINGNLLEARQKQNEIDLLKQSQELQELKLKRQEENIKQQSLLAQTREQNLQLTEQEGKIKEQEALKQRTQKNWLLVALALILVSAFSIFRWYRSHQLRKTETENLKFNKQLSELEMQALRAQMNPHFLFNCLNSIQRFVLENDSKNAVTYLTKFARLVRLILENSRDKKVTLSKEIESLDLYIQMEKLRFDHNFFYSIVVDETIDKEYALITPMLLQPYVENAIWHGLQHKTGEGKISIQVSEKNNVLAFVIEDNGIGRKASGEINRHRKNHTSVGLQITKKRIEMLSNNKQYATVNILDLYDKNDVAEGTRVEINIPLE